MIAYIYLIGSFIGLMCWGLISLHHWLAYVVVGTIIGASGATIWFWGNIMQTIEYWHGTGPRWMHFLFGNPKTFERNVYKRSKQLKLIAGKLLKIYDVLSGFFVTVLLVFLCFGDVRYRYGAITFPITWILCIYLSEVYFRKMYARHRFTRIREDSDI